MGGTWGEGGARIIMGKAAIWSGEEDMVPIQGCV